MTEQSIVGQFQSLITPDCDGLINIEHTEPLLDLIESQARRIEELEAGPEWSAFQAELDKRVEAGIEEDVDKFWRAEVNLARGSRDKADLEVERLREVVEKRECEVCALADMADGRFGLGWWTAEAKAIRKTTHESAQAASTKAQETT